MYLHMRVVHAQKCCRVDVFRSINAPRQPRQLQIGFSLIRARCQPKQETQSARNLTLIAGALRNKPVLSLTAPL